MNEFEKFAEMKLPDKDDFYSSLRDEDISDEYYEYVVKIWDGFEMRTMRDYHNSYSKADALLLADILKKSMYLEYYKLVIISAVLD